jgi:endonuclease YncB( thermonuclease family)/methylphosphotriester-DNA--protein-cysteine methyltransferase
MWSRPKVMRGNPMKTLRKAALLFAPVIIWASFGVAQQAVPTTPQQPSSVVTNSVQLVIEGKVINVHDGDTVTVLDQDNKKFHIRLQGIDAPELKQEFGSVSQENLSRMVLGKQVTIFWNKVDKYRRTVGTIMLDGHDINIEQVKAGLAWHFKKYEDEQAPADRLTYAAAEQQARAAKLGLWKDQSPMAPGDWRQEVKTKRWGPPPPEGTIIGNKNSKKYHRPDCSGYRDMAEKNRVFFKSVEEAEAAGYKRAGNCPAEIQAVVAKTSSTTLAANPASSSASTATATTTTAASTSPPVAATIKAAPMRSPPNGSELSNGNSQGMVVGNKNSKVYHLPGCSSYNKVSEKNQVKFNTVAEAEAAGYRRAGNCSADKNTKPSE